MADFWIISCYCHFLTINDCLKQLWIWSKFQGKMIERFSTTELISDVHLALDCDNWYLIINQIHICTSNERRGFENFVSFYLRCQQFYLGNILFPGKKAIHFNTHAFLLEIGNALSVIIAIFLMIQTLNFRDGHHEFHFFEQIGSGVSSNNKYTDSTEIFEVNVVKIVSLNTKVRY